MLILNSQINRNGGFEKKSSLMKQKQQMSTYIKRIKPQRKDSAIPNYAYQQRQNTLSLLFKS